MKPADHYTREAECLATRAHHFTYGDGADPVTGAALAAEAQVYATLAFTAAMTPVVELETEPTVVYVFRAAWGMTPLGTYTNAEAARMHCEADAVNHNPEFDKGHVFDWLGDESEPEAPYELVVAQHGGRGVETETDYTVTRIEVASKYDAEADE